MSRINPADFVMIYKEALQRGLTQSDLARELNISRQCMHLRIKRYRNSGVELPRLRHGNHHLDAKEVAILNGLLKGDANV